MVKAKIEGGEVKTTPVAKKSSGEVVDLLAALQRSVDDAKTKRGEVSDKSAKDSGEDSDSRTKPKKSGGKKQAAKKSTKKTAKKSSPKKQAKKAS